MDDRMIRRTLRVASVGEARVALEAKRLTACTTCAARAGCGAGALAEMAGDDILRLELDSHARVAPGDDVVVSMPAGTFLGAAGLAYLLPPAVLVLAVALFSALGLSDGPMALLAVPVLAVSFLPLWRAERTGRLTDDIRIERVIPAVRN